MPPDAPPQRLIVGNRIRCPKDGKLRNMFSYKTFEVEPEFQNELNVVLKCPCGHIFSPGIDAGDMRHRLQEVAHAA